MAKFDLASLFEKLTGKLNHKDDIIYRKTRRYSPNGKVVLEGKHAYMIVSPRNYNRKPLREEEKQNLEFIKQAQMLAKKEVDPDSPTRQEWIERFELQLKKGKADPEAPTLTKTHNKRVYSQFDRFVFAILYARLRRAAGINC